MSAIRRWHGRLGAAASVFIACVCLSGLYLNHKSLFVRAHHYEWQETTEKVSKKHGGGLTTSSQMSALKISPQDVVDKAHEAIGPDAPIDEFELKNEHGAIVYKLKANDGREIIVNALSGEMKLKELYYEPSSAGFRAAGWDFNEIIGDLHTAAFGGMSGKIVLDVVAIGLLLISVTGVVLFFKG